MKKILLSSLGLIFLTLSINAQQAQSYSGHKSYATIGGRVGGNEQYTYLVDDRGKTIIHGKYTYSGVNHEETNTIKIDAKYSMNLNCKNGFLDGNLSINGNYASEEFKWREGWKKAFATTKLSGIFKEGKPNGLFSITFQDNMKGAASVTLKNGKYIGAYSFQGYITKSSGPYDHKYWYVMKGQLTEDGKLTGQWLYDTQLDTYNYTFINDVLISETHEKYTTPPRIQAIAKKYANKQITKEEVLAQGFYIQEGTIPLNYVVTGYILNEEFNLYEIGAKYDFSDYVEKKYTKIVELNTISKAGFDLLKENIDKLDMYNRISTGYYGLNKYDSEVQLCSFVMDYDEEYDAHLLWCDVYFTEQYGTKVTGDGYQDQKIYLTSSQAKEWLTLLENRALKNVIDFSNIFSTQIFSYEYGYSTTENLSKVYHHYINNTLTDWLCTKNHIRNLSDDLTMLINDIETNAILEKGFKLTEDQKYIFPTKSDYYTCAYNNSLDILKTILTEVDKFSAIQYAYDSIHTSICEKLRSLTNSDYWYREMQDREKNLLIKCEHQAIVWGIITSLDSIKQLDATISPLVSSYANVEKIYRQNISKAELVPDDIDNWSTLQNKYTILQNILQNIILTKEYVDLRDSLNARNELVLAKLPASAQQMYVKIYNTCQKISYYKEQTFTTKFAELIDAQNGYLKWSELFASAQNKDILIKEQVLPYKDLTKVFGSMYKLNTTPSIQNHQEAETVYREVDSIIRLQESMLEYIKNRNIANQLHLEITELCTAYKGCAKAYKTLCKSYPLIWNTEKDNNLYIKEVLSMLQEIKSTLTDQENLPQLDKSLKKAKTLDDIKSLFRISK